MPKKRSVVILISIILCLAICQSVGASGSRGSVDHHSLPNLFIDDGERMLSVYTPPGYEESTDKYPVLILLNDQRGGDHETFLGGGYPEYDRLIDEIDVGKLADTAIKAASANPMIIVMPDFSHSWDQGITNFHKYIEESVWDFIRANYRVTDNREETVIAGHGWAGREAVDIAMANGEVYGFVALYSPCMNLPLKKVIDRAYDRNYPIRFHFHQSTYDADIGFGNKCQDATSRKYAAILGDLGVDVTEEEYEGDEWSAVPHMIARSIEEIF